MPPNNHALTLACRRLLAGLAVLVPLRAHAVDVDVFDRPVPFATGRPTVTLLANSDSAASVSDPMAKLSYALRDLRPIVIVRVDLRGIPSMLQGIARSSMRTSHEAGLTNFRQECTNHQTPIPDDIGEGLFFVPDGAGEAASAAGLEKGFATSVGIVADGRGKEIARGAFPDDSRRLQKLLRAAMVKKAVVAVTPAKVVPVAPQKNQKSKPKKAKAPIGKASLPTP